MKVLIFSGNHPRHLFIHSALLRSFDVCGVVCMRREEILPSPPAGIRAHDAENFKRHFADRLAAEQKYFTTAEAEQVYAHTPTHYCTFDTFNTAETAAFVQKCAPDIVVVFGVGLIKEPVLSVLPNDRINLHLGLSPWYRGAATLFWPFYNMQPHWAGSTIHQIVPKADAGAIIHQSLPELTKGDGIHDVSCKVVLRSSEDMITLFQEREKRGYFTQEEQRSSGRLYMGKDFKPEHLRVIYDLFNNKMVDAYLNGELDREKPPVISGISKIPLSEKAR